MAPCDFCLFLTLWFLLKGQMGAEESKLSKCRIDQSKSGSDFQQADKRGLQHSFAQGKIQMVRCGRPQGEYIEGYKSSDVIGDR